MTAQYKRNRFLTERSIDWKTKGYDFEGSERMKSKHIIHKEIQESSNVLKMDIAKELFWDAESKQASECYEKELADPENYKCTCKLLKVEDFL